MKLSVIIPTRNRAVYLGDALKSITNQSIPYDEFEVIVVDNGSTDDTRQVVEDFGASAPFVFRYEYVSCPGLHVGRNLGAQLANGDILAYLDDDVIVDKGWAEALIKRFSSNERIALVGGPCRPQWESPPAEWVDSCKQSVYDGWMIGPLSLIDLGTVSRMVSGLYVFGCNFSIRKSMLFEIGGFHPDGMPLQLLRFRGDGETGVADAVSRRKDAEIFYDPGVSVFHRVSAGRLTKEYFLARARLSGISSAYGIYRSMEGSLKKNIFCGLKLLKGFLISYIKSQFFRQGTRSFWESYCSVHSRVEVAHYMKILCFRDLRRWVLQPSYFKQDPCPYWQE